MPKGLLHQEEEFVKDRVNKNPGLVDAYASLLKDKSEAFSYSAPGLSTRYNLLKGKIKSLSQEKERIPFPCNGSPDYAACFLVKDFFCHFFKRELGNWIVG